MKLGERAEVLVRVGRDGDERRERVDQPGPRWFQLRPRRHAPSFSTKKEGKNRVGVFKLQCNEVYRPVYTLSY